MADRTVSIKIVGNSDSYKRAMAEAEASTHALGQSSDRLSRLGPQMSALGGTLTRNVTLPLLAVGAGAAKLSYDFEQSFAKMQGLAGVAGSEVDDLRDSVLGLAGETGRAPQELAEGLYFIRSAGLAGKTALDTLEVSAKGAAAGLGSTAVVADAVTSAINAYGEANITAAEAGDVLAATAREGKIEASQLAPQFGRLLPIAAELGVSFNEVGAGLAFLTRSSGNAELATTQLGGVLEKMLNPSEEGAKALSAIGTSAEQLRKSVDENGLLSTLVDLRKRLEENGMSLADFSRDNQFLQGALQLTGVKAGEAAQVFEALENSTGSLGRAFAAMQDTNGFKMRQAMAQVQVSLIQLGDVLLPLIAQIASFGAGAVAVFSSLPGPVAALALAFGGVMIAVGPVLSIAGALARNWAALSLVFDKVAISAYNASGSMGAMAGFAAPFAAVAVAVYTVTKAVNEYGKAAADAKSESDEWSASFVGSFDPAKASMSELTAEIARLSTGADEMQEAADNALNPFLDDRLKNARDNLDAAVVPLVALATKAAELQSTLGITADEALALAQDTEFMAGVTNTATGELDDEAAAAALVTKQLSDLGDALRAQYDPIFAMQDAIRGETAAQVALNAAIAEHGPASTEAARAEEELFRAIVDTDGAALGLQAAMEDGSVSVADMAAELDQWVASGRLTREQADRIAAGIGLDTAAAAGFARPWTANLFAQDHASEVIGRVNRQLDGISGRRVTVTVAAQVLGGDKMFMPQRGAAGGLISHLAAGGFPGGPSGTDTVPAWLTPGEFVMQVSAVKSLGVPLLNALNAMNAGGVVSTGVNLHQGAGTTIINQQLMAGGGGGTVVHITMPPGSDGQDVVEQIRRYERSNGTAWRN